MSEYPAGSTAKVYYDSEGNEVTLQKLCRLEPHWAMNRIIAGEKAEADRDALKEEANELKRKLFNEGAKNNSDRARVEFLEDKLREQEADSKRLREELENLCCEASDLSCHEMDGGAPENRWEDMRVAITSAEKLLSDIDTECKEGGA
jgi:seryl-tRNA synthetase